MSFFSYDLILSYSSFIVFLRSVFYLGKISAAVKSSIFLSPSFVVASAIDWNVVLSSWLEFLVTSLLLVGSSGAYWHDYILRRFQDLLIHLQSLDYCCWFVSREYIFKISSWPNCFIDFVIGLFAVGLLMVLPSRVEVLVPSALPVSGSEVSTRVLVSSGSSLSSIML